MTQNPIINRQSHSTDHSFDNQSDKDLEESFEAAEKKNKYKKKHFLQEEPRVKQKILCRNIQILGNCQYGDQCFFTHLPLHSQIIDNTQGLNKTKHCKRYFNGSCYFGQKCQFLHSECIDKVEQREFVERQYKELKLIVPLNPIKLDKTMRFDLQRFHHLYKIFGRKLNFRRDELIINNCRNRLQIFISMCKQQDKFEQLLMSNNTSRKESEQS